MRMPRISELPRIADTYGRTSRLGDRDLHGDRFHALDMQAKSTGDWIDGHDYRQGLHLEEADVSGGKERAQLERLVQRIEEGKAGALVVANVSRFSRNTLLGLRDLHRVVEAGGRFVALDGIDTAMAGWELQATIRLAVDADYMSSRRNTAYEVSARLVSQGIHVTGWGNVGYVEGPDRRYVPHPEWGPVITRAYSDRAAGASQRHVADLFRDHGLVSGRNVHALARGGAVTPKRQEWTGGAVRSILASPVYLGWAFRGKIDGGGPLDFKYVRTDAHPPLTDLETWTEANRHRAATVGRKARRDGDYPYILRGLVRCAGCGHGMKPDIGKGDPSYRCRKRHTNGVCKAPAAILASVLERHVEDLVVAALAGGGAEGREPVAQLAEIRGQIADAEAELATYIDLTPARTPGYGDTLLRKQTVIDDLEARLVAVGGAQVVDLPSHVTVEHAWPELSSDERRRVLRGALDFALVRRSQVGGGVRLSTAERVGVLWAGQAPLGLSRPGFSSSVQPFPFDWPNRRPLAAAAPFDDEAL